MSPQEGRPEPPREADVERLRTVEVAGRLSKVSASDFAVEPGAGRSFRAFLDGLPSILQADSFRAVARSVASAIRAEKAVVWLMGGHVIKTGLSSILVRMIERGGATFLAGNGSVAIHDWEIARWGATSEDVEAGLVDGSFGMAEETGREMNEAILAGAEGGMGMGEALGYALSQRDDLVAPGRSVLLAAYLAGVGCTMHAALGAEIIHQHPTADGAAIGETSMRDFRRLAGYLPALHGGGVALNVGSAVLMPEVFLKALAIARNLHDGEPREFDTADFDMIRHYRPRVNVVERPTRTGGGTGYQITGHHEIMIPMLAWAVEEYLAEDA
ncbi:MAG TPA: hypothetical protein VMM35_00745 [Longimicrobiales bacterium]|nr:hypothetical protein [Longimicrobiales bacterium]